jgi:hypothetical protein
MTTTKQPTTTLWPHYHSNQSRNKQRQISNSLQTSLMSSKMLKLSIRKHSLASTANKPRTNRSSTVSTTMTNWRKRKLAAWRSRNSSLRMAAVWNVWKHSLSQERAAFAKCRRAKGEPSSHQQVASIVNATAATQPTWWSKGDRSWRVEWSKMAMENIRRSIRGF